ncbi:hypothetical protein JAAARDRAFT_207695 [Jaapia argillacea MUCL 33604]|uniref:Uncharacterized protein n=1 Tax=Jaapia argillacea MUCL 33604 TaxID=933084 RepID=A0A067PZ94_9AGAM|nr:hypothetical protein JAAARDRAFT_207695 [Jaapia argillacea MUCL 33604]
MDKRAETLEALSKFIEAQRQLLTRTQCDIERLHQLRSEVSSPTLDTYDGTLTGGLFPSTTHALEDQVECAFKQPDGVDWTLFNCRDPEQLNALATGSRSAYECNNTPHTTQRSPLSTLQAFVKAQRVTLLDPVLNQLPPLEPPSSESETELDPEELRRERERQKIRDLRKRKITCGLTIPLHGPGRAPNAVFVRRDIEDESGEVDIAFDRQDSPVPPPSTSTPTTSETLPTPMDIDPPASFITSPRSSMSSPLPSTVELTRPSRSRHPPKRVRVKEPKPSPSKRKAAKINDDPELQPPDPTQPTPNPSKATLKPKSETYKLSWSVSEQRLLEELLERIPDGEKNRWQKISQAMDGKRTPRQVASRVQKYFEKLKRFGVEVGSANGAQ